MEDQIVRDHLRRWAEELVDLTRRNRLLFFRHTASASFEFAQSASEVERGLGRTWGFHLPAPPPADPEVEVAAERPLPDALVVDMIPARDAVKIERGLKNLASKAQSEFLDSGIWVLYLGLGRLSWTDIDGKHASSPLLLVPVNLVQAGAGARWRLEASADGEPALNPALAVKLEKDFDIELPTLDDLPEADLASVLSAVRTAIADSDWSVADTAVLTTFTFQKEVIYRDLRDNEDVIVEHDMVRLLAEGPTSELAEALDFAPEDEGTLDTRHPPEDLVFVRDADATQRQSLIAARAGRSFVMDGPPGTGKSQTITNVIAQLITDGKTVLFVSEKAAALEVVQNRLAEHSLDPFVLALHSHNATRKAVAQDLGAALTDRSTARHRFSVADRAQLVADRERLSAYASAVNEVRSPLGLSVHDVIGRISQLDQLPQVEVPDVNVRTMSPSERAALRSAADQLARAWGPVERGEDFVWRNLQPTQGVGAREGDLRRRVERCRAALDTLADLTATHADELRVAAPAGPDGIESLFATLELVAARHAVGAVWLTSEDTAGTTLRVTELALAAREVLHHGSRLDVLAPSWRDLGDTAANDVAFVDGLTASLRSQMPSIELPDAATDNDLLAAIAALETCATGLESSHGQVAHLGVAFGLEGEPSIAQANRLAELGQLVGSPSAPEPYWMNAAHRAALDEARRVLSDLLRTYRARRDALKGVFTEAALGADLEALHVRFAQVHTGLGKLGSAYRTDKKALAAVTVTGKVNKDVLGKLEEAIEWQQLSLRLSQAEVRHGPTIGARYYPSRADADLDEIERAVAVADRALALAAGEVDSEHLAGVLGRGSNPDPQVLVSAGHVAAVLSAIEPTAGVIGHLTDFSEVVALPVSQAAAWCRSTATQLRNVVSWLDRAGQAGAVKQVAVMGDLLAARAEYQRQSDVLHAGSASLAQVLGPLRDRLDPDELDAAAAWVQSVHAQVGGPVRRRAATALLSTALTRPALDAAFTAFDKSRRDVLSPFGAPQAAEISAGLSGSFERTRELLDHLEATVSDATEWESHVAARAELAAAGWSSVVDACEEMTLQASAVGDVVERAILTRWIDQVLGADGRFTPSRSVDRDQLQAEFKALDAALVRDTAARVINACVARRPKSLVGQAGIINQQAQLKRRHKPVRRLLAEAGDAAQQLKPCFMMSPLSVSQFLPPGLRFDVVIFDEASQVREADAVCCVYRGKQLIVAGDPKQLPPTSFFQKTAEADEDDPDEEMLDFESILDRCKAQGFPALPLSWHYRSRHESLITFSNYSFYDGRLHTFPGATFEAPDLGVELYKVDGEYRRGATRDNPIEAEKVVDRIVFHRRHHPELTLGVVTLSVAQQVCVEAAIERRSPSEIELRQLMTDDRLDGFFVKNLENVQGDERDLIIISTGYGPDEVGKLIQNFGPMSRPGGQRRLNVAVTRAKNRVEVVTSLSPGQITSDNATTRHLARYLDYAERGTAALALDLSESMGDADSPFEEEVIRSVRELGYDAVPQVGVAGYRVDIGVRHPTEPGSYVLGIECDGATYHSSKVARDRDRLRQGVLEGLDWRIHRIWSTAWFSDRPAEVARLQRSIEAALRGDLPASAAVEEPQDPEIIEGLADFDEPPEWAWVYESPVVAPPRTTARFHEVQARPVLVEQIRTAVIDSGPIHIDDVLAALRDAWGLGRAGERIRTAFDQAVGQLRSRGEVVRSGQFLSAPGEETFVRVPDEGEVPRKASRIPPEELQLAIVKLLQDAGPSDPDGVRTAWARLFGWRRTGSDIEVLFENAVDDLLAAGTLTSIDPLRLA